MTPDQTTQRQHAEVKQIVADQLKAIIGKRLARNETPTQIADALKAHLGIAIDRDQVIAYWKGEATLATLTRPLQNQRSTATLPNGSNAFSVNDLTCIDTPSKPADAVKANLGGAVDHAQGVGVSGNGQDTRGTLTGPLQNQKSPTILTDEIKEFIVKGLACFDTPSQVAEAVKENFGIEVTRQHVHVYNPASSQPPALRWRELHAATRQAFLREIAEIGVVHKAVRLRRLDRLAQRCERNSVALALDCLEQAAKECGGMYESRKRPLSHSVLPLGSPIS